MNPYFDLILLDFDVFRFYNQIIKSDSARQAGYGRQGKAVDITDFRESDFGKEPP